MLFLRGQGILECPQYGKQKSGEEDSENVVFSEEERLLADAYLHTLSPVPPFLSDSRSFFANEKWLVARIAVQTHAPVWSNTALDLCPPQTFLSSGRKKEPRIRVP